VTETGAGHSVASILALYELHGEKSYGEDVTQLAHALQCAELASTAGASDELVAAALLHDVGHLLVGDRPDGWRDDVDDDHHEAVGARVLASVFGPAVAAPVALHVTAKRWRCAVDPSYRGALSVASAATLIAQGGPLDDAACERFASHPSFRDAVRLREWDDAAKDPTAPSRALRGHEPLLARLAKRATSDAGR
jgi:[1-hydroxy-2-(trimethylamino)ethyl]phosphonate dioxygenase